MIDKKVNDTQKRLILINDFTGFGRCALNVSLPTVSAFGIQGVPVPTAILSNHLGFKSYFYEDFAENLPAYLENLNALSFPFDGIYTGYLGSAKNAETVIEFVNKRKNTKNPPIIITDPVMGDNGRPYSTHTDALLKSLTRLVSISDYLTPNLTEACMLTGTEYSGNFSDQELFEIANKLMSLMIYNSNKKKTCNNTNSAGTSTQADSDTKTDIALISPDKDNLTPCTTYSGSKKIVITGIPYENEIGNLIYEEGKAPIILKSKIAGAARPGTGDIFASIVSSYAIMGEDFKESVCLASRFISECIRESDRLNIPPLYGVCFERKLDMLIK